VQKRKPGRRQAEQALGESSLAVPLDGPRASNCLKHSGLEGKGARRSACPAEHACNPPFPSIAAHLPSTRSAQAATYAAANRSTTTLRRPALPCAFPPSRQATTTSRLPEQHHRPSSRLTDPASRFPNQVTCNAPTLGQRCSQLSGCQAAAEATTCSPS